MERDRCIGGAANCQAVNDPNASFERQAAAVVATSASYGRSLWGYYQPKDYIRLREIALTVPLPARLNQLLRISSSSVIFSGRNVALLWTRYPGLDPEVQYTFPSSGGVWDYDWFSELRYWMLRVNIDF